MTTIESLEQIDTQLLKVPFEALKRDARDRKAFVDKVNAISTQLNKHDWQRKGSKDAVTLLENIEAQLQQLISQHEAGTASEAANAQRCLARAEHLRDIASAGSIVDWNRRRLPRLLVDHLLRNGRWATAQALVRAADCAPLVDLHVFEDSQPVLRSLAAHDCSCALAWCTANAARLKKFKSKLQFHLTLQQYIELVRADDLTGALAFARAHLAPFATDELPLFKQALALLVFRRGTSCPRYAQLLHVERWSTLAGLFLQDLFKIHGMSPISPLEVHLQAGLTALKCPLSYEEGCTKEDPLRLPHMKELAEKLPWAKHVTSKLVCSVTKTDMNDSNPPMVLPNGHVYSKAGLAQIASKHDGKIVCPVTEQTFLPAECVQAYIL